MPKIPYKQPSDRCSKCNVRFAWAKSDKNLCYWCHNNLEEAKHGNQPLQRPTREVSASSKSNAGSSNVSSRTVNNTSSEAADESNVNSLKPYPVARKRIPKLREDN